MKTTILKALLIFVGLCGIRARAEGNCDVSKMAGGLRALKSLSPRRASAQEKAQFRRLVGAVAENDFVEAAQTLQTLLRLEKSDASMRVFMNQGLVKSPSAFAARVSRTFLAAQADGNLKTDLKFKLWANFACGNSLSLSAR